MKKDRFSIEDQEVGFGSKITQQKTRLINKDGSFNVKNNHTSEQFMGIYHALISMTWTRFTVWVIFYFISINFIFGSIYYFLGDGALNGGNHEMDFHPFWSCLFFSAQTISTVGYGGITPLSLTANTVAAIESLIGLLGFALITGLLYGRFSRPTANILFSKEAILTSFKGQRALQFRIVNQWKNSQLNEMQCFVSVALMEEGEAGPTRKFHTLELEVKNILFFPMTWTINHIINEESPLYHLDLEGLQRAKAELLILVKGFDDTFSAQVSRRFSYTADEMKEHVKFVSVFDIKENGEVYQDLNLLSSYTPL